MEKICLLVDDDEKSAEMLWDEFQRIFYVSNTTDVVEFHSKLAESHFLERKIGMTFYPNLYT